MQQTDKTTMNWTVNIEMTDFDTSGLFGLLVMV
jgi:hypothetical protein